MKLISIAIIIFFFGIAPVSANDETVHIAVASNFASTLEKLSESFSKKTGHKTLITKGATGILYNQITHGAPFDIFLSADASRPQLLEKEGMVISNNRFTYAVGILALWHPSSQNTVSKYILNNKNIKHLAIANPALAPYGLAAKETLIHEELWQDKQQELLFGNNISQAFHFTASGNNTAGFVALSQLLKRQIPVSHYWVIPETYHAPINQQAVLLNNFPAATEFMGFLKSNTARKLIIADGYKMETR